MIKFCASPTAREDLIRKQMRPRGGGLQCFAMKAPLELPLNRGEGDYRNHHPRMIQEPLRASGLCYPLVVWSNSKVGSGWPAVGSTIGFMQVMGSWIIFLLRIFYS